ncbi:hypothetical protein FE257_006968 [Aspergillus nanangensis]|uniref:Uncharacterized protein n=1 Tax=Aspergillus nanangensis TaxID=2582783 RepID=A0AAD4CQC4_ASPNN|nr:hypothetical protein FE257_006968 [Aspergillus nanangensis]
MDGFRHTFQESSASDCARQHNGDTIIRCPIINFENCRFSPRQEDNYASIAANYHNLALGDFQYHDRPGLQWLKRNETLFEHPRVRERLEAMVYGFNYSNTASARVKLDFSVMVGVEDLRAFVCYLGSSPTPGFDHRYGYERSGGGAPVEMTWDQPAQQPMGPSTWLELPYPPDQQQGTILNDTDDALCADTARLVIEEMPPVPPQGLAQQDGAESEVLRDVLEILESRICKKRLEYSPKLVHAEPARKWYLAGYFRLCPRLLDDFHRSNPGSRGPPRNLQYWIECWNNETVPEKRAGDNLAVDSGKTRRKK